MAAAVEPAATALATDGIRGLTSPAAKSPGTLVWNAGSTSTASTTMAPGPAEELEGGALRIVPTEQVRERIRDVGRRVVSERGEALRILAEHDPDDDATAR